LARIAGNGVRTIIVETANRFARDLMVQGVGFAMLRDLGITLIAADSPSSFLDDGPTSKLIRQILGAVSEFDKAMTVAKLKGARDRVRRQRGKCEGRKSYAEREGGAELVAMARQLHTNPHGRSPSLRPSPLLWRRQRELLAKYERDDDVARLSGARLVLERMQKQLEQMTAAHAAAEEHLAKITVDEASVERVVRDTPM
jgi:Resolvase, N terminal domain